MSIEECYERMIELATKIDSCTEAENKLSIAVIAELMEMVPEICAQTPIDRLRKLCMETTMKVQLCIGNYQCYLVNDEITNIISGFVSEKEKDLELGLK